MSEAIKQARKNANLSQVAMARELEIPVRTIQNWEGGVNKCPRWAERLIIKELKEIGERNKK